MSSSIMSAIWESAISECIINDKRSLGICDTIQFLIIIKVPFHRTRRHFTHLFAVDNIANRAFDETLLLIGLVHMLDAFLVIEVHALTIV